MAINNVACLKQISSFLQTPLGKISLNSEKMPTCNIKNKSVTGFVNIIVTLLKEYKSPLLGNSVLEEAEIRQWLEYCVTYACHCGSNSNQILLELNTVLATKTYFVGNNLTIADVVLFYTLQDIMGKCNHLDKEKYLNVSRWYDNIQQNNSVRKDKPVIDFSTIFLSCINMR